MMGKNNPHYKVYEGVWDEIHSALEGVWDGIHSALEDVGMRYIPHYKVLG